MRKTHLHAWWLLIILAATTMSCSLLGNVQEKVDEARQTVDEAATKVQEGKDLLSTGQAVVTQIQGNEIVQTALAVATQKGPSLLATAEAFATQEGPSLIATAKALGTQNPHLLTTAEAFGTQVANGEAPADIPVIETGTTNFIASELLISYEVNMDMAAVRAFYETEMPQYGWAEEKVELDLEEMSIITYTKPGRTAALTLNSRPGSSKTVVLIAVQNK